MTQTARFPQFPNTRIVAPRGSAIGADFYYDGVLDNEEVQAAINSLPDAGGTILIVGSRLNFGAAPVIDRSNIYIVGEGKGITTLYLNDTVESNLFVITPTANRSNIKFSGFSIDGNKANHSSAVSPNSYSGILITDTAFTVTNLDFDGIEVKNTESGAGITTKNVTNLRINNCKLTDNGGYGIDLQDTTNLILVQNEFSGNDSGPTNIEVGGVSIIHDNIGVSETESGTPVNAANATQVLTSDNTNVANNATVVIGSKTYTYKTALTEAKAEATLTSDATAPDDGDTVIIGNKTYIFKTVLTGAANEVLIGASAAEALDNIKSAVNGSAGAGTTYGTGTVAHTQVDATTNTDTTQLFVAKSKGVAGNAYASTEVSSHLSFGDVTFLGGADAVINEILIGADADASLTNLKKAINHESTEGTEYSTGTIADTNVSSGAVSSHAITLTALVPGVAANSVATTETSSHLSFADVTLTGGVDGTVAIKNEIQVDTSYLYVAIDDNTITGKNWRRVSLGSAY